MKKRTFSLVLTALVAAPLALSAALQSCSPNGGGDAGADANPYGNAGSCTDGTVFLLSCTAPNDGGAPLETYTDEACIGLDTAERARGIAMDNAQAPAIDQPTEGAAVPAATPFTFTWRPQGLSLRPRSAARSLLAWHDALRGAGLLVGEAQAHCSPFSGLGYALTFRANGQVLLRAQTAAAQYRPTASAWALLQAARGAISLTVEAARFGNNAVTAGPVVQATPRTFTLAP